MEEKRQQQQGLLYLKSELDGKWWIDIACIAGMLLVIAAHVYIMKWWGFVCAMLCLFAFLGASLFFWLR